MELASLSGTPGATRHEESNGICDRQSSWRPRLAARHWIAHWPGSTRRRSGPAPRSAPPPAPIPPTRKSHTGVHKRRRRSELEREEQSGKDWIRGRRLAPGSARAPGTGGARSGSGRAARRRQSGRPLIRLRRRQRGGRRGGHWRPRRGAWGRAGSISRTLPAWSHTCNLLPSLPSPRSD